MIGIIDRKITELERKRRELGNTLNFSGLFDVLAPKYDFAIEKLKELRDEVSKVS